MSGGPADRKDELAEAGTGSQPGAEPGARAGGPGGPGKKAAPDIGFIGMLRWGWRQLTTMRSALILLLILALAAIPGSLLPQRIQDPARVTNYIDANGAWGQIADKLQLFDVYSSFWFSAVYILLMISLIGCVIPRTSQHFKAMRARPPKAPRRLTRMPGYESFPLASVGRADEEAAADGAGARGAGGDLGADELLDAAAAKLKSAGYRIDRHADHVAAERGYLRETGNLLFHVGILAVTVTMAIGSTLGYSGQRILVQGETFTNSLVSYDSFTPGRFFSPDRLPDFRLKLNDFESSFDSTSSGPQFGQPRTFAADVTETRDGVESRHELQVNEPIRMDGSRAYLTGNGYAPKVTVRNNAGDVVFAGPVVFLPADGNYASRGVIKVPDTGGAGSGVTTSGSTSDQLGFGGVLLPTAGVNDDGELISTFAELRNPVLALSVWKGDLGLGEGVPQSVYELDTDKMQQVRNSEGQPMTLRMSPGQTEDLPDGMGSITFDGIDKFVSLDVRYDPTQGLMLVFAVLLFAGLAGSMFVPRRRMWVRVKDGTVEVAALARGDDPRVEQAARALSVDLQDRED
ncbi:cytochrome c biogenesis protein ResB [Brevibacterium sp. 91QC2O2]|uniref:cytochrome c biogenesis protein ResB n=1 Tax=Brevibacterium TaxID=1696 RepID=UPI00211BB08D|nr:MULTISPECIES: cytochrome c biogenesis protein ResB [unclassified Brevibacterium]MCQ9368240.1 cytochrome c biogenesis protein ResB [Brevibacterium sp. 91QC2O2]MCQ9385578.1 cytochrome c biogenesis protein ResB [Brevibacterium sp. 68QC2CO]